MGAVRLLSSRAVLFARFTLGAVAGKQEPIAQQLASLLKFQVRRHIRNCRILPLGQVTGCVETHRAVTFGDVTDRRAAVVVEKHCSRIQRKPISW